MSGPGTRCVALRSASVRGPKRPVTRMRVQIRVSGRSARKSQRKGHEPRSGSRGALLRLTRSGTRGALLRDFGTGPRSGTRGALLRLTRSGTRGALLRDFWDRWARSGRLFRSPPDAGTTEGTRSPPACRSHAQIPYPRGPSPCLGKDLLSASACPWGCGAEAGYTGRG